MKKSQSLIIAFIAVIAALALVFIISGISLDNIYLFFLTPFRNRYNAGNFINRSAVLLIAACGTFLASRAGLLNLGGEGQAAIGGICGYLASLLFPGLPYPAAIMLILLSSFLGGAANALIAAALKELAGIDVLITSYLLSGGTITLCEALISGPLRDPDSYLMTTKALGENYRLHQLLPPSSLNITLFISLLLFIVLVYFLNKTTAGFRIGLIGTQRDFARYTGIRVEASELIIFSVGGGLHGIAGGLILFGSLPSAVSGFSSGIGWNALTASLLSSGHSAALLPSVFIISWIETGTEKLILQNGLPLVLSQMITGVLFILFALKPLVQRRKRK